MNETAPQTVTRAENYAGKRVFVVGSSVYPDSFEWHVADSLRQLGCIVELFYKSRRTAGILLAAEKAIDKMAATFFREPERRIEAGLLRRIAAFAPDVVLVLLGNQLSPKTVAAIRAQTPAPLLCWCQDQMTTLGRQSLLGSRYDAVFVKDHYMQDLFSRMIRSTSFFYLAEACNPRMHRPIPLTDADRRQFGCDVMLAGSLYYYRQEILEQLADLDIKLWGQKPDWMLDRLPGRFMGRAVHGDDKVRASLAAKICLNNLHYAEVNGLNCRAFEIAGCGGFQIATEVPALREHFEPNEEIVTFCSIEDLREKTRYFIKNPDAAAAIAERGRIRAHRDHTYEHRLRDILRVAMGR